jgi:hypothetical protein
LTVSGLLGGVLGDGLADMVMVMVCGLAELASLFGQLQSRVLPLVEAFGIGPVNAGAGGTVEGGHSVARTCPAAVPLDVGTPGS